MEKYVFRVFLLQIDPTDFFWMNHCYDSAKKKELILSLDIYIYIKEEC